MGCKLKQNANEGCNSCASFAGLVLGFIACFILLVIAPLASAPSLLTFRAYRSRSKFKVKTAVLKIFHL